MEPLVGFVLVFPQSRVGGEDLLAEDAGPGGPLLRLLVGTPSSTAGLLLFRGILLPFDLPGIENAPLFQGLDGGSG